MNAQGDSLMVSSLWVGWEEADNGWALAGVSRNSGQRAHRHTIVVEDPVLIWHKAEINEMSSWPENVVCDHSLDKLVLHSST